MVRPHRTRISLALLLPALTACTLLLEHRLPGHHPAFEEAPTVAQTADGSPGDALNVALIAREDELLRAMRLAEWTPADAVTLRSSLRIGLAVLLHRHYAEAPVSRLFVWQRPQDFAFERASGTDPRRRHHARFWRSARTDQNGRPLWLGAATYDAGIGLSHRTGRPTHHIAADIDAERDKLIADLQAAGCVAELQWQENFQPNPAGRNGGGDPWRTDRRLPIAVLAPPADDSP
jgi:hypothetical protein